MKNTTSLCLWLLLSTFSLQVFSLSLSAANIYWEDGVSGTWFTPNGWRNGSLTGAVTNAPLASDVAYINNGNVTIGLGISATTGAGYIGANAGSSGAAIVSGRWQSSAGIYIGQSGTGHLRLQDSGSLTATGVIYIGNLANSSGRVDVVDNGYVQTGNTLIAGVYGTGYLHVAQSGTVISNAFAIGRFSSGYGNVVVEGYYKHNGQNYVGYDGMGVFEVASTGTAVGSAVSYVGYGASGSGTGTVAGAWMLTSNALYVGYNGKGYLEIPSTGIVSTLQNTIAYGASSIGTVVVGGIYQSSGNLVVGTSGTGFLRILPTGTVFGGSYSQNAASTLAITLQPGRDTPYITANGAATLRGSLTITDWGTGASASGTKASEYADAAYLILRANGGISGGFTTINVPGGGLHDYIASGGYIRNGNEYYVGYGLAWNSSPEIAHGSFTIYTGETFDVDVLLADRAGITSGWDGSSLTKKGGGTLVLSAENPFTGSVTVNGGAIRLNGSANASLGALRLNGGAIDFGGPSDIVIGGAPGAVITPAYDGYRTLTVASLDGAGDLIMKIDLGAGKNDHLIVAGDATGKHRLLLRPASDGLAPIGDEPTLTLVTIGGLDSSTFTSDATFKGGLDYGPFNYMIEHRDNQVLLVNNGFSTAYAPIRGVPGTQGIAWFGQQDNLGKRLGELRAPVGDGNRWDIWARAHASQSDIDATRDMRASKFTLWGAEIGADKTWLLGEYRITFGLYVGYGSGSQDFTLDIADTTATGDSDLLGGGVYALWLNNTGWFANFILSGAHYKNNFTVTDQSANRNTADYNDTAYGATGELGKRITLGETARGWFAEPAAQLSHLRIVRADYLTEGASPMSVRNVDAVITRLRAVMRAGRAWRPAESGFLEIAGRLAFIHETSSGGEVRIGSESWRPNLDGNRGETGVGVIWRTRGNCQFYLDYEAAYGDCYKKLWDISLGMRLMF